MQVLVEVKWFLKCFYLQGVCDVEIEAFVDC